MRLIIPHKTNHLPRVEMEIEFNNKKIKATIVSECQGTVDTSIFLSIPDSEFKKIIEELPCSLCEKTRKVSII